jgi:hypothetical protein
MDDGPLPSMLDRFKAAVEILELDSGIVRYLKTPLGRWWPYLSASKTAAWKPIQATG